MTERRFCGLCGLELGADEPGPVHRSCEAEPAAPMPTPTAFPSVAPPVAAPPVPGPQAPPAPPAPPGPTPSPSPAGPPAAPATPPPRARRSGRQRDWWSGRPREWPSVRAWIGGACLRNFPAVVVGIGMAWFNAPIVVVMGAVGAVLGALAGLFSGSAFGENMLFKLDLWADWILPLPMRVSDLLPTAALQIGGIIGAFWGAANGALQLAWLAFYWPWAHLFNGDPAWPVMLITGQVVTAGFCGVAFTTWSIAVEPARLRRDGARRMSRREAEWLMPLVEEVAHRMGLAGLPKVLVTDSREVNAYAASRHIVVHRGLLNYLDHDKDAVRGVLAHELAHWRYGDPVGSAFIKGVALPLYAGYELAIKLEKTKFKIVVWLLAPVVWGVTICVRYVMGPVAAWVSRRHELRCDQVAKRAGYGPGLRTALEAFAGSFDRGLDGWDEVVLRSHPPTEHRLEALEEDGQDYPLMVTGQASPGPVSGAAATGPRPVSTLEEGW